MGTIRSNPHTFQLRKQTWWDHMMCLLRLGQELCSPISHSRGPSHFFHTIRLLFIIFMKQQIVPFLARVEPWPKRESPMQTPSMLPAARLFVCHLEKESHSGCSFVAFRNYFSMKTRPSAELLIAWCIVIDGYPFLFPYLCSLISSIWRYCSKLMRLTEGEKDTYQPGSLTK